MIKNKLKYFYTLKVEDRFWVYDRYSNKIVEIDELTYKIKIFTTYDKHQFDERKAVLCLNGTSNGKIQEIKLAERGYRTFKNFRSVILFFYSGLKLYPLNS